MLIVPATSTAAESAPLAAVDQPIWQQLASCWPVVNNGQLWLLLSYYGYRTVRYRGYKQKYEGL